MLGYFLNVFIALPDVLIRYLYLRKRTLTESPANKNTLDLGVSHSAHDASIGCHDSWKTCLSLDGINYRFDVMHFLSKCGVEFPDVEVRPFQWTMKDTHLYFLSEYKQDFFIKM